MSFEYNVSTSVVQAPAAVKAGDSGGSFFGEIWDTINPLQHIPIVSAIYQNITGDTQSSFANVVGGGIFGGALGAGMALASEIFKEITSDAKPSEVAFADTQKAESAYTKMRVTTQDWLNPNFLSENIIA